MSASFKIDNFGSINLKEKSKLDAEAAAAATGLTLQSTQGYSTDDFMLIGLKGAEGTELKRIDSVTNDTALVLTEGLDNPHGRFEDVVKLFGDQIQVYRAANVDGTQPADGSFSTVGSPISIDPDQMYSEFTDSSGGSDYWYKFVYKNSVSSDITALADSIAVRGGGISNYCSFDDIRNEAGFQNNPYITDAKISSKRAAAQSMIDSALQGIYVVPFSKPINPLIIEITTKLAAGYLLVQEYGGTSVRMRDDGQKKIDEAMALLARIDKRELTLTGVTGVSQEISGSGVQSWPNADTAEADAEDGGGERMFRVSDRY